MERLKQIYSSGIQIVHFRGWLSRDLALCGQDLAGDSIDERGIYEMAEPTSKKVDCKDCIKLVKFCKSIKKNEWIEI